MARSGTLVMLACHCVYDPGRDVIYTDRPEFVHDRPVYEAHIHYAFRHLQWCPGRDPLLVLSGGCTRRGRECSESRSYLEWAVRLGIQPPDRIALEEYALTSIENLLFSLYVYRDTRGVFPEAVDVISWGFKRGRFEAAMEAIGRWAPLGESWPGINFFGVGDLSREERGAALSGIERGYIESLAEGLQAYYANPAAAAAIARRDVWGSRDGARERYRNYPLPF